MHTFPEFDHERDDFDDENYCCEDFSTTTSSGAASFVSGFVAFIGRPNAGKSTLLNAIMQTKLAITSNTAQTTRHRFRAIYNSEHSQIVIVDTPGLHKPHDALGDELNKSALKALEDVDVLAFLLDASQEVGRGDFWVLDQIKKIRAPRLLIVTKSDLVSEKLYEQQIERAKAYLSFDEVVVVSAIENKNIDQLIEVIETLLPEGPRWFPEDMRTDQSEEVLIAEFIREKILRSTSEEVPHSVGMQVEDLKYNKKKNLYSIMATIYVERESQKGIIIGKSGSKIKRIGTEARHDLELLLQGKVYLDLRVKLKKDWRRDAAQIRRFGYGEGL